MFLSFFVLLFSRGQLYAQIPLSFSFDPSANGRVSLPYWIPTRPLASPKPQAELSIPIIPISDPDDLALTVVFREEIGAYLSVYWQENGGKPQLLSANLFENIGLLNQRTLLINRPGMGGPGTILIRSSQPVLNIIRVRLDWVRPGVVRLADDVPNGALILTGNRIYAPEEVNGSPLTPIADTWEKQILTTSITDEAERIERGVVYQIEVPHKISRARIEVMVNGLRFDQNLRLWINGRMMGALSMDIPDLIDPGYIPTREGHTQFVGWRKGVMILSAGRLLVGANNLQFDSPQGAHIAVRDFLLQVDYSGN